MKSIGNYLAFIFIIIILNTLAYAQTTTKTQIFNKFYVFNHFSICYSPDSSIAAVLECTSGTYKVRLISRNTERVFDINEVNYVAKVINICVSNDSRFFISRIINMIGIDALYVNDYYSSYGLINNRDTIKTRFLKGYYVSNGDLILQYAYSNSSNSIYKFKTLDFRLLDSSYHKVKDLLFDVGDGVRIEIPYYNNNRIIIPYSQTGENSKEVKSDSIIFYR